MSNVKIFSKEKYVDFPEQRELQDRILNLIYEYAPKENEVGISAATVIGILYFCITAIADE